MELLDEIGTYIAGLAGIVSPVVKGPLPPTPNRVICLREYQGEASEAGFGTDSLKFEYPRIQVVVRGEPEDYAVARAEAQLVYEGLGKVQAESLSGTFYHAIRPLCPPYHLRNDANRRPEIVCNCRIEKDV